jgi:hypothetical protein
MSDKNLIKLRCLICNKHFLKSSHYITVNKGSKHLIVCSQCEEKLKEESEPSKIEESKPENHCDNCGWMLRKRCLNKKKQECLDKKHCYWIARPKPNLAAMDTRCKKCEFITKIQPECTLCAGEGLNCWHPECKLHICDCEGCPKFPFPNGCLIK